MVYLDHAASTAPFPEVLDAMLPWFQPCHIGNPSSIHSQGVSARHAIEKAREQVAQMIGADPSEIFFTSGGTEANNAWFRCLTKHIVLTDEIEHHSISEPLKNACVCPLPVVMKYARVWSDGSVDMDDLERLIIENKKALGAVSVMWVNNELGTVNPIKEIGTLCKKYDVPFHTDAVAAAGHVPIDVHAYNVDFLSLSGHKFGAPQGIGVLYISNRIRKEPWVYGGGQERGLRGGTENVPGIVGIGKAAEIVTKRLPRQMAQWAHLRDVFLNELSVEMDGEFHINGDTDRRSSAIISLTLPGVNSESLLLLLDQQDIYLSAGSACSASDATTSHVLRGIGLSEESVACTVRISMGFDTTDDEMRQAAQGVASAAHRLKVMYS